MTMKTILALDCAGSTGWAFQHSDGLIESGVTPFLGTLNPGDRWLRFAAWLDSWDRIELILYEEPIVHFKHRNGLGLGYGFEAILHLYCAKKGIRCVGVNITHLKKWATGKGNADKALMLKFARSMGWKATSDDECDALWLLEYARKRILKSKGTP